ncbi:Card1-like endonuclease domain-containing protein [Methylohalobius crimeensis]|uniref:Card1-like endonuclease domain-containing protein n=1 Tax=Methylohalobius crimeensis TaxID=244365 RepID=UPI0003B4C9BE|nr:DUF1887 family CARF protein [Methylohalobius crimeensis]
MNSTSEAPLFPHHVYLVSEQATPNITPALDPAVRPEKVTLVVSGHMQTQAHRLTRVLKEGAGVAVEEWPVADAWDVKHLLDRFLELLEHAEQAPVLNATGGTKPMSIAAVEVFRAYERPIFYVHPHTDELFWLYPHDFPKHQLADRIKLPHFLLAYGAEIEARGGVQVPPARRALADHLIRNIEHYGQAIRTLNWYAASAGDTLVSPILTPGHRRWPALQELLEGFEQVDALRLEKERIVFPDEEARAFVNGGWLEWHVFHQVQMLRKDLPLIQDVAQGVRVVRSTRGGEVENELDVAFLANNRFYLMECKTRHFRVAGNHRAAGAEALYKLDTLKDLLGGLHGQGMLVSYLPLKAADHHRAAELGIRVCQGRQLQNLPHILREWIDGR